jgi:zinc protease
VRLALQEQRLMYRAGLLLAQTEIVNLKRLLPLLLQFIAFGECLHAASAPEQMNVMRAALPNGFSVVIIRNSLAPVVTVESNFLVGGDEIPPGFPGIAHAQETWLFVDAPG